MKGKTKNRNVKATIHYEKKKMNKCKTNKHHLFVRRITYTI